MSQKIQNNNDYITINTEENINILIVGDLVLSTELKLILENFSYKITLVDSINKIPNAKFNLIILNIENKDIDFALLPNSNQNSIFIASKQYSQELIKKAYSIGIKDFLHIPYIKEEVIYKVQNLLDQQLINNELQFNRNLIQEYKKAIDKSTIVSKADKMGNITYVNEAFINISGYSKDELIGEPHNIVRHPDMDSELFEEMWETISNKQTWNGLIKNMKKNGEHYWVQTVINPIVDPLGNIIEYISLRSDVTQMEDLKIELVNELNLTASNFMEAYQLSKEYENAISESNILSRTNLKGEITYINKEFEKTSGYRIDEILGKSHKILKHPDTSKETIKDLWKTITSGNIWKGLIQNKGKNGKPYWVDSVILPIKNRAGKIQEYMSIRHDVTEIIHLHEEIENTQKELIYRMGAIAESRSKETGNHIKRVAEYSRVLAKFYGLNEKECELLYMASPMHDIGKISTPDAVLKKPGKLDSDEWEIMKQHAKIGADLLASDKPILNAASIIALSHHEKYDGSGYPNGIQGDDIHIYGRITALADVFDALGSDRYYKKAWEDEKIFALLKEESGKHFDPKLVTIFFENLEMFLNIRDNYKDLDEI